MTKIIDLSIISVFFPFLHHTNQQQFRVNFYLTTTIDFVPKVLIHIFKLKMYIKNYYRDRAISKEQINWA